MSLKIKKQTAEEVYEMTEIKRMAHVVTQDVYKVKHETLCNDIDRIYQLPVRRNYLLDKLIEVVAEEDGKVHVDRHTLNDIEGRVLETVNEFIARLQEMPEFDKHFRVSQQRSGSFGDDTKVKDAEEHDYLITLRPRDNLTLFLTPCDVPATSMTFKVRSCCYVTIEDGTDDWSHKELDPAVFYADFYQCLMEMLKSDADSQPKIKQHGPAVSFFLTHPSTDNLIKVDLCLAIEVSVSDVTKCLVANGSNFILPENEKVDKSGLDGDCHVVCFGQLWKISACAAERKYMLGMRDHDPEMTTLYRAMKVGM